MPSIEYIEAIFLDNTHTHICINIYKQRNRSRDKSIQTDTDAYKNTAYTDTKAKHK